MLYAHGPDLCRESDLRHAMANCFEALIGSVFHLCVQMVMFYTCLCALLAVVEEMGPIEWC